MSTILRNAVLASIQAQEPTMSQEEAWAAINEARELNSALKEAELLCKKLTELKENAVGSSGTMLQLAANEILSDLPEMQLMIPGMESADDLGYEVAMEGINDTIAKLKDWIKRTATAAIKAFKKALKGFGDIFRSNNTIAKNLITELGKEGTELKEGKVSTGGGAKFFQVKGKPISITEGLDIIDKSAAVTGLTKAAPAMLKAIKSAAFEDETTADELTAVYEILVKEFEYKSVDKLDWLRAKAGEKTMVSDLDLPGGFAIGYIVQNYPIGSTVVPYAGRITHHFDDKMSSEVKAMGKIDALSKDDMVSSLNAIVDATKNGLGEFEAVLEGYYDVYDTYEKVIEQEMQSLEFTSDAVEAMIATFELLDRSLIEFYYYRTDVVDKYVTTLKAMVK